MARKSELQKTIEGKIEKLQIREKEIQTELKGINNEIIILMELLQVFEKK